MSHVACLRNLTRTAPEIKEPEVAKIQGTLPPWLRGSLIRNGPGKWDLAQDFCMNHLFDGFSLVSRFVIGGDSVAMTMRYLESEDYLKAVRVGRPVHLGFGTKSFPDPNKSLFSRFVSNLVPQETSDNCCTGIYKIGNDVFTGVDGTYFYQVDPVSLKTIGKHDANKLFNLNVISPKPNIDPITGDLFNVGSFLSASGVKHGIVQVPAKLSTCKDAFKKSMLVSSWPSRWSGSCHYTHSFGLTKNYYVVIDQPYLASITSIAANVVKGKPMIELFEYHPKEKNRFFLVDRSSGKVLKTEYMSEETFFYFHIINCYEDNNHMIVDVIAYEDTSNFDAMFIDRLRQNLIDDTKPSEARRYVFPIADDVKRWENEDDDANLNSLPNVRAKAFKIGHQIVCRPQSLTDFPAVEGPTINKKFLGRKYTHFYVHPSFHTNFLNKLGKVNADTGELLLWTGSDTQHPSDPMFLPNPSATQEDDGVILSTVTETNEEDKSFLLFLDAKSMKEIARAEFNLQLPLGVDGIFIATQP